MLQCRQHAQVRRIQDRLGILNFPEIQASLRVP